ncbi:MAG: peptidoglycan DD-metalloendopeptidase family protein [Desulfuromonadaceae bacterium]
MLLGFCLCCGLCAAPAQAQKLDQVRQSLQEIEARIERTSQSLTRKQEEEDSLQRDLKTVSRQVTVLERRLQQHQQRLAELKDDMETAEAEIRERQKTVDTLQGQVQRRLVAIYKGGGAGWLALFSGETTPARMAEDYDFFRRIVRKDRELLTDFRARLAELQGGRERLTALKAEQEALVAQGMADRDTRKKAAQLKQRLLAKVRKDQAGMAEELAELKERATRLSALVKKLESAKTPEYTQKSSPFADQKGRLSWPVNGTIKLAFGPGRHVESGTRYESHGIEISAAVGQPVTVVWPGRVVYANWFNGYGNLLIVDHGDSYFTLYAQAARLEKKVGDQVQRGDVVALAGLEGKEMIYFEIRYRGTPLDPAAWLNSR